MELRSAAIDFTSSELFQSAFKFARFNCILMNQKLMLRVTCRKGYNLFPLSRQRQEIAALSFLNNYGNHQQQILCNGERFKEFMHDAGVNMQNIH